MSIEKNKLGLEVYKILAAKEYDYQLTLYDADGNGTTTPLKAKWIYVKPTNFMVQFPDLDNNDRPEMYFWKSQGEHDLVVEQILQRLRAAANQFGIGLTVNDFSSENTPKQYAKMIQRHNEESQISEGAIIDGSTKRSYYRLPNCTLIIVHSLRVDDSIRGARSRNVKDLYIRNNGEQYRFPCICLPAAKAMTHHINLGGKFNDRIGNSIISYGSDLLGLINIKKSSKGNLYLQKKANDYIAAIRLVLNNIRSQRKYQSVVDQIISLPRLNSSMIQSRTLANNDFFGIENSECMSKYELIDDYLCLKKCSDALSVIIPNINHYEKRRIYSSVLSGDISGKFEKINTNVSNIQEKIRLYASILSEMVNNDLLSIVLSNIALKNEDITKEEASCVLTIYKIARIYQKKKIIKQQDELQQLFDWIDNPNQNMS